MNHVSGDLRRVVVERAGRRRQYCLVGQDDSFFPFELDHIISEKQAGVARAPNTFILGEQVWS